MPASMEPVKQRTQRALYQIRFENTKADFGQRRIDFLNIELAMCSTFAKLAVTHHEAGDREFAERSIENAEYAHAAVLRFLSDSKHSKSLPVEQVQEFTAELQRLRDRLDGIYGIQQIIGRIDDAVSTVMSLSEVIDG